jgi:hypothetical protein
MKSYTRKDFCWQDALLAEPTLFEHRLIVQNRGIHVFHRETQDGVLRSGPSSLKSFK